MWENGIDIREKNNQKVLLKRKSGELFADFLDSASREAILWCHTAVPSSFVIYIDRLCDEQR